ncbi:DUF4974 domain-containing protein [Ravibacter arvi]|uniref:DUF4974 domain-containing protein n=1 Tax=Ravibacter arvi TaxID=2051041 RepID=A0ABP8LXR1_9BACT
MDNYEEYYKTGGLIARYLRGELTESELTKLNSWRSESPENESLFVRLTEERHLVGELSRYRAPGKDAVLTNILTEINAFEKPARTFIWYRYAGYAAAAVLFAGISYLLFSSRGADNTAIGQGDLSFAPGGDKAVLILEGGRKIDLESVAAGEIARQGSSIISKSEDGIVSYELDRRGAELPGTPGGGINTITTPRGGQYRLRLPDGSKVWLNAQSSLRFPTRFDRRERKVALSGEAYFEVVNMAAQGVPFRVISGNQTIEVLGTEFNVNGYANEGEITTTLLSGKVKVGIEGKGSGTPDGKIVTLSPGQQASVTGHVDEIKVSQAKLEESVAWKNGHFQGDDTDLGAIMRQIERWYDVQVTFEGGVEKIKFNGKIPRNLPAEKVFEIVKASNRNIQIKTEGKKVRISI